MSANLIPILWESTLLTLYMVAMSTVLGTLIGAPLGIFLATSRRGELLSAPVLNTVLGLVVNAARSTPFIILVVAIIPLTRLIAGTSIGSIFGAARAGGLTGAEIRERTIIGGFVGSLVANDHSGAMVVAELADPDPQTGKRVSIGLIRLDVNDPNESEVLIPARERGDIDWDAELSKLLGEDGEDGENGNSEDTQA